MIRRVRMASGLVLFAYVATHLLNHSLGIVSLGAMEAMLGWVYPEIRGRDAPIAIRTLARVDELAATVPTTAPQPVVAATGWAHSLFARLAS